MLTMSHAAGANEPAVRDITLGDLLQWAAETTPDRIALIAGVPDKANRRQWSYAELYAQALRTARALRTRFEPGERVAIWAYNIPQWIMMEFGAAMAGVILVTVNPGLRSAEVEYVLKQSRAAGVMVVPEFRGNPMLATVQALVSRCPELREIICFDQWDAFLASGDAARPELPMVRSTDAVMIQYTSGTTGFPKGALLHHRGLVNNGAHTADRAGIPDGAVQVTTMPLFHTGGCVCCVLGAVSKRATQVLVEAFDPGLVIELMATHRSNAMLGVPTMLVAMMEHPSFASADLSSLKAIYSGGYRGGSRKTAGRAVHDRVRPDRVLAGRLDDLGRRQHRRQGQHHRHADAERRGEDRQPGYRRDRSDRRDRRDLYARLSCHAGLFRGRSGHQGGDRYRGLAAHRRPRRDGCAGLLHDRGTAEGHDHSRRRKYLSARTGGIAVPPSQGRRRRGGRIAGSTMGRSRRGVYPAAAGHDDREGRTA